MTTCCPAIAGSVAALDDHGLPSIVKAARVDLEAVEVPGDASEHVREDRFGPVVASGCMPGGVLGFVPHDVGVHGIEKGVYVTPAERCLGVDHELDVG